MNERHPMASGRGLLSRCVKLCHAIMTIWMASCTCLEKRIICVDFRISREVTSR